MGKIGIATIGPAGLPADLRIRLEDAAANGLKASGTDVITAAELSRARASAALGNCADAVCEQRLAQVTDARYWLRGTCQLDTSTYRLHLELVDARSGAVVVARDDTCDICTEADAAETASVAASSLKAALGRVPVRLPGVAAVAPTTGTASTAAAPQAPAETASAPHAAGEHAGEGGPSWITRVLPWVAFAAGAGAIAGGVYYLAINGQGSDCRGMPTSTCQYLNDTVWRWGVPLLAAGAVLATTGIVLVKMGRPPGDGATARGDRRAAPSTAAQIAVSPAGVLVSGTF